MQGNGAPRVSKHKGGLQKVKVNPSLKEISRITASAVLTALSFLLPGLSWLAYLSLAPIFRMLFSSPKNDKAMFFYGWLFGSLLYLMILHWLLQLHPLDFLDFSRTVSFLIVFTGWIVLSLFEGLFHGFLFLLFRKLSWNDWRDVFTLSFLWILMEWAQGIGILGFPFCRFCVTQYQNLPMIQSASLFGAFFLSFLLVFCSASAAFLLTNLREGKKRILAGALALCLLNDCYGILKINQASEPSGTLKIALIQGNISSNQKWADNTASAIFKTYEALTKQVLETEHPDLVIWPETVLPLDLNGTSYLEQLQKTAADFQTPLIVGGFYYDRQEKMDYNSVYYIQSDGRVSFPMYAKRKLVPFGEFLPFRNALGNLFPVLKDINAAGSNLEPGSESITNSLSSLGTFGSLVCFDSIFPHIARESVKNGAQLLNLVTNDSWFKDSAGVYQHNAHAVLRAVENRRWITRTANTGISCFISPTGEIMEPLDPLTSGYTISQVSLCSEETFYTKTGDLLLYVAILYLLLIGKEKKWKTFLSKRHRLR